MLLEFEKKEYFYGTMVGWPWQAAKYSPSRSITPPPQQDSAGRKQGERSHGLSERQGDHLPIAIRCKTDLTLGKLIECIAN